MAEKKGSQSIWDKINKKSSYVKPPFDMEM